MLGAPARTARFVSLSPVLAAIAKAGDRTGDLVVTEKSLSYPFNLKPILVTEEFLPAVEFPAAPSAIEAFQSLSDAVRAAIIAALPSVSAVLLLLVIVLLIAPLGTRPEFSWAKKRRLTAL